MSNATAEPIKLKNEGDRHTMTVADCQKLTFGRYPEYEFTGTDGSVVRVPESATLKQLGRLDRTAQTIVGCRITIKRDKNSSDASKPYWGLYLEEGSGANGTGGAASAATVAVGNAPERMRTATTTPTPASPEKPKGYALYKQITAQVLKDMPAQYAAAGIPLTSDATAAIIATVFIAAERNGH